MSASSTLWMRASFVFGAGFVLFLFWRLLFFMLFKKKIRFVLVGYFRFEFVCFLLFFLYFLNSFYFVYIFKNFSQFAAIVFGFAILSFFLFLIFLAGFVSQSPVKQVGNKWISEMIGFFSMLTSYVNDVCLMNAKAGDQTRLC